jgi:hypothetical protein
MDNIIISKITLLLQEGILKGDIAKDSPMKLIAKGMEIMESFPNMDGTKKKEMLIKVVEKIAAGADGVAGTDDDIIPVAVVGGLKAILEKDLVGDIIQVITSAAKGEFNINKAMEVAEDVAEVGKACVPSLLACLTKCKK